jgi:hypothetical protein
MSPHDEGRRLVAICVNLEEEEEAVARQLSHRDHNVLSAEQFQLEESLKIVRLKHQEATATLRLHFRRMRNE